MYDLVIIGAGPAGLTASIYASCFHLKHLVIGKDLGGQMVLAPDILNYPGFEEISGKELTQKMVKQVKERGGEIITQSVIKIQNSKFKIQNEDVEGFEIETEEGKKYQTRSIILATGTERRKLNVLGEVEYTGKGVYYCATCERLDYRGKVCGVVGGANSAVQAAAQLAQAASKVYLIYRGSQLRGDPVWLERVEKNSKIEVVYNSVVTEIIGDREKVTKVKLRSSSIAGPAARQPQDHPQGDPDLRASRLASPATSKLFSSGSLSLDKLFIEIGGVPGTALLIPLGVEMDTGGYIKVNTRMATNIAGVFAAGDLVSYGLSIEQISSAVGLGARAAASAFAYIKKKKTPIVWGKSEIKRIV